MNFLFFYTGNLIWILIFFNMFSGCEAEKTETGASKVNLSVVEPNDSDDNISAIYLFIKKIELKGPDGWSTYKQFDIPLQINLMDSKTSRSYFLGEKLLAAGQYWEARLVLDNNNKENNDFIITSGCYLQYQNGEIKPVYIPHNSKEGILAKGAFNLPSEGVVNITLNFDIREGLKETENTGSFLLRPKIKMIVSNDTGIIEGEFEKKISLTKLQFLHMQPTHIQNLILLILLFRKTGYYIHQVAPY